MKHDPRAAEATMETLREHFKPYLGLSKARLTCFLMLVLAIIGQRTVSLVWLAQHPHTGSKAQSVYRRFQRFFASCTLPARRIGALVLALAPKPAKGWVLAMDRTNWQFGKTHINILVVSVILNGVGLPIAWRVLPKTTKRGNSRRSHRIKLMQEVLSILPSSDIRALTMDREFVGDRWLSWLKLMGIPFVVRVKANTIVGGSPSSWWCERNRWKRLSGELHEVFGLQVHFAAKRICKGRDAHLAVISFDFQGAEALEIYRMRWGIETLFSHLKRRGYQFEDTHMTKGCRISKLMGVLAVAFALSYQWGRRLEQESGIKLKVHGHRAKSVFRQGFESLNRMLHLPVSLADRLSDFLDQIVRLPLTCKIVV
jgi:hypothetical protein